MFKRYIEIPNGPTTYNLVIYECNDCGEEISEKWPRMQYEEEDIHYCRECAFIRGLIDSKTYMEWCGISNKNYHAGVSPDGEAVIWAGSKTPPWERTNREIRNSQEYADWRTQVFERDNYTCQHCKKVGGKLNAHHIKEFSKYPDKRFDVDNGLTLCVECHKKVHRKRE